MGGGLYALFANFDVERFKGIPLSRSEAPAIWAEIDRISTIANSPPVSHLYIDNEFNASASIKQTHRFKKNRELEVTVGLPLMAALSQQECASVIAHEIGHHHGDDSRRSIAIYNASERAAILTRLAWPDYHLLQLLLLPVAMLFVAYRGILLILSQKLRHRCEFEADNFAATICGVEATGRTDIAMSVFADDIQKVLWEPVEQAYRTGTAIPKNLFANLPERFNAALKPEEFAEKLNDVMKEETSFFDSHPCTKERLENIGATVALPKFDSANTAARVWLGENYDFVANKLQDHWLRDFYEDFAHEFEEQGNRARRAKQTLEDLAVYHQANPKTPDSVLAKFVMQLELAKPEEHKAIFQEALDNDFDIPDIRFRAAIFDLHKGTIKGIERLLELINTEAPGLCSSAHEVLLNWIDNSDEINVRHVELRSAFKNEELIAAIKSLRSAAQSADKRHLKSKVICEKVKIPQFPQWQVDMINSWFRLHPEIDRAWLHICDDPDVNGYKFYYLTITHINSTEGDWCTAFEEFDSLHIPILGTVLLERMIGDTSIENMMNNGKHFPALHKSLISNPPFYQRDPFLAKQVKRDINDNMWGTE